MLNVIYIYGFFTAYIFAPRLSLMEHFSYFDILFVGTQRRIEFDITTKLWSICDDIVGQRLCE